MLHVRLNDEAVEVEEPSTVLQLLECRRPPFARPASYARDAEGIRHRACPLVKVIELDGRVTPIALAAGRPLREGTEVRTRSPLLERTLADRLRRLRENGECEIIAQLQEFAAAEAESAGLVDLEKRSQWRFEPRLSAPSIFHDPNRCVRCRACVDTCNETQGVGALSYDENQGVLFDESKCTRCGQCIHSCPTGFRKMTDFAAELLGCRSCTYSRPLGAMREVDDTARVLAALKDPAKFVVVEFAPAVRATLGEEFGMPPGTLVTGKLYAALRRLGFQRVWDTNFSADLTILEEGHELIHRLKHGGVLPQFTSCSPGWIRYCETFFPDLIPNLSSAKSPQQMLGAVAKTYAAERLGVDPRAMFVVSLMPCTAKKSEAARPEMQSACRHWRERGAVGADETFPDIDAVLTSRELVKLLKLRGLDLAELPEEAADPLLGEYSGAAPIFGRTGGVMEAALRTAYEVLTGSPLAKLEFEQLATLDGIKTAVVPINGVDVRVAVAHGLGNAKRVCQSIRERGEFSRYHFIEFMACEGGCIGGGGQLIPTNTLARKARTCGVNRDDSQRAVRKSHLNREVEALYRDFLKEPLGHLSHHLLHTTYTDRSGAAQAGSVPPANGH